MNITETKANKEQNPLSAKKIVKRNKTTLSVFRKNQDLEFSILMASFCCLPWGIGKGSPFIFLEVFFMILPMSILIHLLTWPLRFRKNLSEIGLHKIVYFEGPISTLLFKMYQAGLKLEGKIGEYYIFNTNYYLLPNNRFVIEEEDGYCVLQAKQVCLEFLKRQIDLKDFLEECEIDNDRTADKRQKYSPPSQALVIPKVDSNTERDPG
jgi:hypothetical protein